MTELAESHLVLADGAIFPGCPYGARGATVGEAVFTTAMTGYQEVLTDPSYCGQLVVMTAPEIGNTGVNAADTERVGPNGPRVAGFVVRDASTATSSWRAEEPLEHYLDRHGVVGIREVDTRKLTMHLRLHGAQNGAIGTQPVADLLRRAREAPSMAGLDLVARVSPAEPYTWTEGRGEWAPAPAHLRGEGPDARSDGKHVCVLDCGVKRSILRCLVDTGFRVTAVPARTPAHEVLALAPDGVLLSNGPGDPSAVPYAIETVRGLVGKVPIFGICLGHQLLALALGAKTFKLKFGHRGVNQPVKDLSTGRVEVTTQNHGFCVAEDTLPPGIRPTHLHLNDETNEGIAAGEERAFGVQYHPEAAAGPHDALYLFGRFSRLIDTGTWT